MEDYLNNTETPIEEEKKMDEFEAKKHLEEKRREIKSFDDLVAFLKYVEENFNYDYGVAPRAMAQAALAVSWYFCSKFGITGFQAGFVMWEFVRDWQFRYNRTSLKILDYDNMLYPQYDYKFEKTISSRVWASLQKAAKENLEKDFEHAHPDVVAHWQSIVDGKVPFGFTVKED